VFDVRFTFNKGTVEMPAFRITDSNGKILLSDYIEDERLINLSTKPGMLYLLEVMSDTEMEIYQITVSGAQYALGTNAQAKGLHLFQSQAPLYAFIPKKIQKFSIILASPNNPDEAVAMQIVTPSGKVFATLDTSDVYVTQAQVPVNEVGFWSLKWIKPRKGFVDDAWIRVEGGVAPWLMADPAALLKILPKSK
jgi:hypothetical protein